MESYLSRLSNWLDRTGLEGRAALESLRMAGILAYGLSTH
jgi:hypothetical protein